MCDYVHEGADHKTVELSAVTGGSEENKEFFKWTPGGKLTLPNLHKAPASIFVPGQEYYIDITLATPPTEDTSEG